MAYVCDEANGTRNEVLSELLSEYPDPPGFPGFGERSSVRYGNSYRIDKAFEQSHREALEPAAVVECVNGVLERSGLLTVDDPFYYVEEKDIIKDNDLRMLRFDYEAYSEAHELAHPSDVVNVRFARMEDGRIVPAVCAVGADLNFAKPPMSRAVYALKEVCTSASIILAETNAVWCDFLLLFPLRPLGVLRRGDVERLIGNAISQRSALLDLYSHIY